uniref:SGS domain-containing protein n=1 Tax=Caenorhabditis japonica TaxID=281687 RepID=A0A8R1E036_CAEJA
MSANSNATPRYDWYQSDTDVVLTILKRGVQLADCHVSISDDIILKVKLTDGAVIFDGALFSGVKKEDMTVKCTPAKIEIRLPKNARCERWASLLKDGSSSPATTVTSTTPLASTSSTTVKKNWDFIEKQAVKEEEEESLEGDAAVNKMFRKIYNDATDDVRKAMMKSYSESGGTVLSTNWEEIQKKKTEIQPPACMEYKNYET